MGISKEFLLKQMGRLELNYGKDRFRVEQDMFDLWYEMFQECEEPGLKLAVDKCIRENEFAPNIAGLMKYYREIDDARKELGDVIKAQYNKVLYFWGEAYDSDTYKAFVEYIMRFPKNMRKTEMIELSQRMISYSFDCDGCGRKDKPTIKEYIQGAR